MRTVPHAQLRCRLRRWYIDLTYNQRTRKVYKSIGPYNFDQAKAAYEAGHESGRWIKEGIGDR